ncbi:MAG: hypothetical protein AAGA86_10225 [Bacteroidota bacterium]
MGKVVFFLVFVFCALPLFAQQGFKVGIQGGLPIGDYNDLVGVVMGGDLGYMAALGEVVDLGLSAGYLYGFPEKYGNENSVGDLPSIQFVPLAGSLRLWPSNAFSIGVDAGYALGLNEGNDGGIYLRPLVGFLLGPQTELNFSYTNIGRDDTQWTTVTMGVRYTIPSRYRTRR